MFSSDVITAGIRKLSIYKKKSSGIFSYIFSITRTPYVLMIRRSKRETYLLLSTTELLNIFQNN